MYDNHHLNAVCMEDLAHKASDKSVCQIKMQLF